ncbi:hypothetical protein L218DRAFT_502697 [Marasmius fiardii PR-910]|nr:hypothetical protein L218DRAFT_502697 [Marasmius fiardii PR-910]
MEYPLNIRIAGDPPSVPPRGVDIWTTLSPHIHKGRELTLALQCTDDIDHLPPIQQLIFPNLHSYRDEMTSSDKPFWPWFWQAIREAPKLVRFLSVVVPFSQLTAWENGDFVSPTDVDNFLNSLGSCKNLDSLMLWSFSTMFDGSFVSVTAREVKLPLLRWLSISTYHDGRDWLSSIVQSLNA